MAGSRGGFNSRFGFIMAAVGSAVGLGNLVRFPAELNDNGGAAFLLVYVGLLFLVGLPAILGEMSIGKISNASPVNAFRQLAKSGKKFWGVVGMFAVLGAVFVLFFYTVLAGWALRFFFETFRDGWFDNPTGLFSTVELGPWAVFWHFVVTTITIYIVGRGVSGGIEKVTVVIMPALFAIVIGIVIFALFQPGMAEGYKAIFKPDWGELSFANVSAAVGQVFFSLSLGQGAMLTYASYMQKKQSVTEDGLTIGFADSGVAILAGMMIFPTLAFAGLLAAPEVLEGSSLGIAFRAMPQAFIAMGDVAGRIIGGVFFLGLFFAALSSAISLLEVPTAVLVDNLGLNRIKAALLMGLFTYTFGVLAGSFPHFLDLYDAIAINIFVIIAVLLTTIFAGWFTDDVAKELDRNTNLRVGKPMLWMMKTITPVLIFFVFIAGGFLGGESGYEFWGDGAGFKTIGETMKAAFSS